MESLLINDSKQGRNRNSSATQGQLTRIRGAELGLTGDDLRIVAKGNLMPGYRQEQKVVGMDSGLKNQNDRGGLCVAAGCGGHSLMSLVLFVLLAMMVLPQCMASDPCSESLDVEDKWRVVSVSNSLEVDYCDKEQFQPDKWYSFSVDGKPATIPTTCIRLGRCGTKVPMRVDLQGQALPEVGKNISASLCGSYDILGRYDCCVLKSEVIITKCQDNRLVYNFPFSFDRCPVAVCVEEQNVEPPREAIANMGEEVATTGAHSTTVSEETTTVDNGPETTTESEDSLQDQFPPQPLMQNDTNLEETTTSNSSDLIVVTNEELSEITQSETTTTTTTNKLESESEKQTANYTTEFSTEFRTATLPNVYTFPPLFKEEESVTNENSTFITEKTFPLDLTTQPVQSSLENVTEYVNTTGNTNQEITSEPHNSTSDELLSTSRKASSDPSFETSESSNESLSTLSENSFDLLSTASVSSDSTDDNDTNVITMTGMDLSEMTSTDSTSELTSAVESKAERTNFSHVTNSTSKHPHITSTKKSVTHYLDTTTLGRSVAESSTSSFGSNVTQEFTGAVTAIEMVRFVFMGDPSNVSSQSTVLELLDNFLSQVSKRLVTEDNSQWIYKLHGLSDAINFENRKTYMDFKIVRSSNSFPGRDIFYIFEQYNLKDFLLKKSNLTLLAECHISKECQYAALEGAHSTSLFQTNAPAFITIIVLGTICFLVLMLAVVYSRLGKRGSWKAPPDSDLQVNRQYVSGNQSPLTDAQIMKDEMIDGTSFNGTAKDGDANLHTTWVIPLDQEPNSQKTVVAITTEDTQF